MIFRQTDIPGVTIVDLEPHCDERGFFARLWCADEFQRQGFSGACVQSSLAFNHRRGTIRGLHYQAQPHGEEKCVRCVRGAVFAVAVDLRPGAARGRWTAVELSADNRRMLVVPPDCAFGYQTLADQTELLYMMSSPHVPEAARGVRYDDAALAVRWPMEMTVVSERDRAWPDFR